MTCKKCPFCGTMTRCPSCVDYVCQYCGADIEKEGRAINKALSEVTSFPDLRRGCYEEMDC